MIVRPRIVVIDTADPVAVVGEEPDAGASGVDDVGGRLRNRADGRLEAPVDDVVVGQEVEDGLVMPLTGPLSSSTVVLDCHRVTTLLRRME